MKTNKLTLVIAALFFASISMVNAQVAVSAHLGSYSSTTHFDGISILPDVDPMKGFSGGIQIDVPLDEYLSVVSGLNFKKKGFSTYVGTSFSIGGMDIPVGVKAINRIDYFEIPLMLKYLTPKLGKVQPYISAGPSVAYAESAELITRASAIISININRTEFDLTSDQFNRMELSGNIAAGLEMPYKHGFFSAEIGYDKALTNFTSRTSTIDLGARHSGIGFRLGYGMVF